MSKASPTLPFPASSVTHDDAPPLAADLCPWLTKPAGGRMVIEGRAIVPEGYALPRTFEGFALTWQQRGRVWHFRGELRGDLLALADLEHLTFCGPHPTRIDRASYEAPARIDDGEALRTAALVVAGGQLQAVALLDDDTRDEAEEADAVRETEAEVRDVFGGSVVLGPWARNDEGRLEAPVSWRRVAR